MDHAVYLYFIANTRVRSGTKLTFAAFVFPQGAAFSPALRRVSPLQIGKGPMGHVGSRLGKCYYPEHGVHSAAQSAGMRRMQRMRRALALLERFTPHHARRSHCAKDCMRRLSMPTNLDVGALC